MIYFLRDLSDESIKIGTTVRLSQRIIYLQGQYQTKLQVLGVQDGGRLEERALHDRFEHLNIQDEWFRPDPELLSYIAAEAREWDGVDEAPKPPKVGTLVRVSDELAEALKDVTGLEKMSVAEYGDLHILPAVRKRYRELILKKAKMMEGKG